MITYSVPFSEVPYHKGPVEGLLRSDNAMRNIGFHRIDDYEKAQLVIVNQLDFRKRKIPKTTPVVLVERVDCANSWCRDLIRKTNVHAVLKVCTLRDPQNHNITGGRHHEWLLGEPVKKCVKISDHDLNLIKPGASYHSYNIMKPWQEDFDLHASRDIDVTFMGTVNYGSRSRLTEHRKSLIKKLRELCRTKGWKGIISGDKKVPRGEYNEILKRSKVVVSPWGFGESCYRDFEALYAGALLVKPDSHGVLTWPDIHPTYSSLSDAITSFTASWEHGLSHLIEQLLHNWYDLGERRESSRNLLKDHFQEAKIADYYSGIFREALQSAEAQKSKAKVN